MPATITVQGGLTAAPEMRYSQAGVPIASGTVASTDRYMDRQSNEWRDGKKLFVRWSAFKDLAENIAASMLDKGAQVTVTGKLHTREYEDREGNKRSSMELEVTDFAVSLKRATAQVTRTTSQGGQGGHQTSNAGAGDTWVIPGAPAASGGVAGGGGYDDDTPF
mgnify:CR=1 FL=1